MRYLLSLLLLLLSWLPMQAQPPINLSPSRAITIALADQDQINDVDQPFQRYLFDPKENTTEFNLGLRLHVNLLSRQASLAYPVEVVHGLWRVDTRDYDWDRRTWDKLGNIDPYFHKQQVVFVTEEVETKRTVQQPYGITDSYGRFHVTEYRQEVRIERKKVRREVVKNLLYAPQVAGQLSSLAALTQSNAPIVRADWFMAQTARQIDSRNREDTGTGYYDFLQLKSRNDYFKLIGLRQRDIDRVGNEVRAVVRFSGVSAQNRQVVLDGAETGPHWTTLEVFDQQGRGVAINQLRSGELTHDAEEHYAPLPNGLPATYLSNAQGVQQSSVPDKIGGNRSVLNVSNDLRVHVNFSCWQCHLKVLQDIPDDVRPVYTGRLVTLANDKRLDLELRRAYLNDLNQRLQRNKGDYADVIGTVTNHTPTDTSALYSAAVNNYLLKPVTLQVAARELGVPDRALLKALRDGAVRLGRGDFRTDTFLLDDTRAISRLDWEDAFQQTQDTLYGVLPVQDPTIRRGGSDKEGRK